MIRQSRLVLTFCAVAALGVHSLGLWVSAPRTEIEIEAGQGASEAVLGSSFADMVAGAAQPVSETTVTPNRQSEEVVEPTEPGQARRPDTAEASTATPPKEPAETAPPQEATETARPETVRPETAAARTEPTETARADAPAPAPVAETASPVLPVERRPSEATPAAPPRVAAEAVKPAPAAPADAPPAENRQDARVPEIAETAPDRPVEAAEAPSKEVVEAEPDADAGLQVSRRPQARPQEMEQASAARQSPEPERRETRSRDTSGNNAARDASRGSASGSEAASAARQGRDTSRPSDEQGNAAASNYPGLVMRHIARVRLPRATSRGAALLQFSIADGGRLASVGVARSSGSSRLDRAAVTVVQKAAPFPAPPAGAQRRFSIKIEGR